jgi:hypothetical protein
MFEGCLEHCLTFIGVQPAHRGCSSAELSEFICEDLLPFQGWAANATLRDTIVRLLLTTKAGQITLYTADGDSESTRGAAASREEATRRTSYRQRVGGGRKVLTPTTTTTTTTSTTTSALAVAGPRETAKAPSAACTHVPLTTAEAVELLDAGRVAWVTSCGCSEGAPSVEVSGTSSSLSSASARTGTGGPLTQSKGRTTSLLYVAPSRELRERILGFPIRNEKQEMVSQFIVENAMHGWEKLPSTADFKARYKTHLVSGGLKWLLRMHKVTMLYMYRKTTHEVLYRYFPHFALPLSEREKCEQPQWMSEAGPTSMQTFADYPKDTTTAMKDGERRRSMKEEEGMEVVATSDPSSVVQRRLCRRCHPLERHFARQRRRDPAFPRVVFDLQLTRRLVQQSPERRLLMQDAVHAVFAAHNLYDVRWEDFGKAERMHLRRLLDCAGLRIVVATLTLRGHRRELRLVLPAEDLRGASVEHVHQQGCEETSSPSPFTVVGQKRSRSCSGSDVEGEGEGEGLHSDDDGDGDRKSAIADLADAARLEGFVMRAERSMRDDNARGDEAESGEGSDADGAAEATASQQQSGDSSFTAPSTACRRQSEAAAVLRVDPSQLVEVQAAHEAERRPLALTAFVPRFRLQLTDNHRNKLIGAFMEKYMKLRDTLATQYMLRKYSKVFMLVYVPRLVQTRLPPSSSLPLSQQATPIKTEDATPGEGGGESLSQRANTADNAVTSLPTTPHPFLFASNDARLPKGVTAYSVNTVLEALMQATPYHAASLPRLSQEIDITTLQRRVLPLLRQLNYVYTTGFSQRGRKRVGMVVLRTTAGTVATAAGGGGGAAAEGEEGEAADDETLDDEAKRAVLDAEAGVTASAAAAGSRARLPSLPSGKAIPSTLVLAAVPAVSDGATHSAAAEGLLRSHPNVAKAVNRIMAVRNGYARSALQRVSRLHMELWAQHCLYAGDDGTATSNDAGSAVRVCEMYDRMTLSTYCIVVGLPQGDLAGVLGLAEDQSPGDANVVGQHNSSTGVWSTALKALPPSLYGWCVQQGMQMLCMCLTELQHRQLVRCSDNFQHLLQPELRNEVCYALCPSTSVAGYTYHFKSSPLCASSSLYACMRYWLPFWNTVRGPQQGPEVELLSVEPNPSIPQVVALSKVTRHEPGVMAAQLYQNCGVPRELRRSHRLSEMHDSDGGAARGLDSRGHVTLAVFALPSSPTFSRRRARRYREGEGGEEDAEEERRPLQRGCTDAAGDAFGVAGQRKGTDFAVVGSRRPHPHRAQHGPSLHKAVRTEISGATVADALQHALHHYAPLQRVEEVVRLVLRGRGQHVTLHPLFSVPPLLPPVLGSSGGGADLTHAVGSLAWSGNVYHTEFNTGCTGQGGATYNRMLSLATLHMGGLGETLRVVRQGQAKKRVHRAQGASFCPSTESLKAQVESVYAPRAELPATTAGAESISAAAGANTNDGLDCVASLAAVAATTTTAAALTPDAAATRSPQQTRLAAELEVVADILRMILFSDQAHYRASIARGLLSALNANSLVTRARSLLQRMPVFGRSRRPNHRVPLLSLVQSPYVLAPSALRGAPQPCANIAVLHAWAHAMEDMGQALTSGPQRLRMDGQHTTLHTFIHAGDGRDDLHAGWTLFPSPLQLVRQPTMDLARLATAATAVRDYMTKLSLPHLAWPRCAVECERIGRHPESDEAEDVENISTVDGTGGGTGSRGRKRRGRSTHADGHRKRCRTSTSAAAAAAGDAPGSADSESDFEDAQAVARVEAEATRQLYPARTLKNLGDPSYLQDLPVDGPPTASEQRAVVWCQKVLAEGQCALLSSQPDAASLCGVAYPSVFHHVDGSFHSYMWQLVVHTVYRFVLRVPGIGHVDLECRLMASGVLSQRAVRGVLRFLVERHLLVYKEEELSEDRCAAGGGGVLTAAPRARGPFQRWAADVGLAAPTAVAGTWSTLLTPTRAVDVEGGVHRRCYTAIAPLEAVQLALSAASW